VAELCVTLLGVDGAGISMVTDVGHRAVVCATNDVAQRIEDLQLTLGEGPCVDAIVGSAPVLVADLRAREDLAVERWPAFLPFAADAGVRAVFAFPLRIGVIRIGALDLYRAEPGAFSDDELSAALLAAELAGFGLLAIQTGEEGDVEAGSEPGAGQAQVHQATGMVMVQLGVPIEEALLRLRARAFATGQPLAELAAEVVQRRVRFEREDR
jgi:hypothetical protein